MFYSGSTRGFYDPRLHASMPDDVVEVSNAEYVELFSGQSKGMTIEPNGDGFPVLVKSPELTAEQLIANANAKRDHLLSKAAIRIAPLQDAVDLDDATPEDVALLKKWKQYRVALNRIQDQAGFPSEIDWPEAPE